MEAKEEHQEMKVEAAQLRQALGKAELAKDMTEVGLADAKKSEELMQGRIRHIEKAGKEAREEADARLLRIEASTERLEHAAMRLKETSVEAEVQAQELREETSEQDVEIQSLRTELEAAELEEELLRNALREQMQRQTQVRILNANAYTIASQAAPVPTELADDSDGEAPMPTRPTKVPSEQAKPRTASAIDLDVALSHGTTAITSSNDPTVATGKFLYLLGTRKVAEAEARVPRRGPAWNGFAFPFRHCVEIQVSAWSWIGPGAEQVLWVGIEQVLLARLFYQTREKKYHQFWGQGASLRMAHDAAARGSASPVTADPAGPGAAEGSSAREDEATVEVVTEDQRHTAAAGLLGVALSRFMRARSSRSRSPVASTRPPAPVGSARLAAHADMSDGDFRELLVLMTARIDDLENSVDGLKAQIRKLDSEIPVLKAELMMQMCRNLQRHD
ncbi:unnamed protein product, partial [Symbiodinium necroappetens]